MYKIDLHTHSEVSPDGGLRAEGYRHMLDRGGLDYIAVTDHNTIAFAQELHQQLGDRIIVGEEIATSEGEIIGLYLKEVIPPKLSALETTRLVREQGGLVYVPHPFETVRKGLSETTLNALKGNVDIIEIHNGRAIFQNRNHRAKQWATEHHMPGAAGSDAHGHRGWGRTYTDIKQPPTKTTLTALLREAQIVTTWPGVSALSYPKLNRLRRKFRHVL